MFPPELGEAAGGRSRRVGQRGRPLSLVVSVGLFVVLWTGLVGMAMWEAVHARYAEGRISEVIGIAFWSMVFALLVWRVWRGGPMAIRFMGRIGTMIGVLWLAGTVAFTIFAASSGGSVPQSLSSGLPGLLGGCVLVTAGSLLRRRDVARWAGA